MCGQDLLEKQKINGGNIKYLKIHINQISIVYKGQQKEQLSERCVVDLCFLKTLFQSVFLFLIFKTMQLHTNNKVNSTQQPSEQIQISNICVYCEFIYVHAGTCGILRFFNANR